MKKKLNKKLALNLESITELNEESMATTKGGTVYITSLCFITYVCITYGKCTPPPATA
ncbi:natural product precursor [Mucilaginibacter gracilis]|uniref:Natural product n=1 Tax=Mucilaginibacter gracilis TaxID=423350 RepID=A0A495J9S5_9SPHI|nr:class I lanthipeptide [Mucilaginibacter gracilis]RKR85154.1 natural product precursor [Mucilaginibacter gracilis]